MQKVKKVWIPQFRLQTSVPINDSLLNGFIVDAQDAEKLRISQSLIQYKIELYAPPRGEGTPDISLERYPISREEAFIVDKPFFLAVTHG